MISLATIAKKPYRVGSFMDYMMIMVIQRLGRYLLAINAVTFGIRGWDKYQAIRGGRRISEKQLLKLCRAGGRIGALLGMETRRHKTIKGAFLKKFWSVVAVRIIIMSLTGYQERGQ